MHESVALAHGGEDRAARCEGRARPEGREAKLGQRQRDEVAEHREIERPVDLVQLFLAERKELLTPVETQLAQERLAQRGRHGVLHFDADDGVAATPDGVLLDRLKQVAGCFFVDI